MLQDAENFYDLVSSRVANAIGEISPESGALLAGERLVTRPPDFAHGDFSSSVALRLAKTLKRKPMEIAGEIGELLSGDFTVKIAAPGFVNITLNHDELTLNLKRVERDSWIRNEIGAGKKVNIEFVSANPTGPLHVGHGRGAVIGDVIGRLLGNAGFSVVREYYVNDVGRQIDTLGDSVLLAARRLSGQDDGGYTAGYAGEYIEEIAKDYLDAGHRAPEKPSASAQNVASGFASEALLARILDSLTVMGIVFDVVSSEKPIHEAIPSIVDAYKKAGLLYEASAPEGETDGVRRAGSKAAEHAAAMKGGTFLRTSKFGDEVDRVLLRDNGEPTYFTADIAYHIDKMDRTNGRLINVWGADHGGHVRRIKAAIEALGRESDALDVVLCQMVRLKRGDTEVKMSKRSGEMVMLTELLDEVGVDAVRFFFLMRSPASQCDFDLELAVKKSSENPVFYCQYAHARTCQLVAKGSEHGIGPEDTFMDRLTADEELEILRLLVHIPETVRQAAINLEVHRLPAAAMELAGVLHRYQTAGKERDELRIVRPEESDLSSARLYLVQRVGFAMKSLLRLMGVSAPERM